MKSVKKVLCMALCLAMVFTTTVFAFADETADSVTSATVSAGSIGLEDGTYTIAVVSNYKMFKIAEEDYNTYSAEVKDRKLVAKVRLNGDGYSALYLGSSEEATEKVEVVKNEKNVLVPADAERDGAIAATIDEDGRYCFEIPVESFDTPISLAALGSRWFDRQLIFFKDTVSAPTASYTAQNGAITVKWTKASEDYVIGYDLQVSTDKEFSIEGMIMDTRIESADTLSQKIGFNKYYVRVRTVRELEGFTAYSEWSNVVHPACASLTKTSITSLTTGKGYATLKWSKRSVPTGYQIQYSTSSTFASSKTKTVSTKYNSTLSRKLSGLTSGKTYYFRVRTYKTTASGKEYSAWSTKKSIKIK